MFDPKAKVNLEVPNAQEPILPNLPDEKLVVYGKADKDLTAAGADIASGLLEYPKNTKALNLRLSVEIGENSLDRQRMFKKINDKPFDFFVDKLSIRYGIPKDKLLADPKFREVMLKLRDYSLDSKKRLKEEKKYFSVINQSELYIAGYVGEKKEGVKEIREGYVGAVQDIDYNEKVAKAESKLNLTPEEKLMFEKHWAAKKANYLKCQNGEKTEEEYEKENIKLNKKIADDSGNKELIKDYEEYVANVSYIPNESEAKIVVLPIVSSDKPVDDKNQVKEALSDVSSDSFQMDVHDDGGASVVVGPEKFPMEIHVFKNDQTNKYVYYISDKYADSGIVRVDSGDLSGALDGRYLDSYVSNKLNLVSDDNDSPNKIPDDMIVLFAGRLLGNGKVRDYKIDGENREVLNAMIKVLELPSAKYPNFYKKIEALNIFFQKEDNISGLRRRLLAGEQVLLDDL